MTDIARIVARLGGFAQKQQLVRRGARDSDLTRAVRNGSVIRARQGWYSTVAPHDPRTRAVRVGGRLTGLSAVAALGGWVLENRVLHVSVPDNAARLRSASNRHARFRPGRGVVVHWDDPTLGERGTSWSVALADALYRVVLDEPFEQAVAALDWALHTGALDEFDFESLILSLPERLRGIRDWVDSPCESLPESVARTRLRMAGHHVRTQVNLGTGEVLDLLVDECTGIEVDGEAFHINSFERDRDKDITIACEGMHGLRPSANAVFHRWERFYLAVCTVLAQRGVGPPAKIQDFGTARGRRIPRLRERHERRRTTVLSFREARRE
jgi:very-short-patch-repair endonuclease